MLLLLAAFVFCLFFSFHTRAREKTVGNFFVSFFLFFLSPAFVSFVVAVVDSKKNEIKSNEQKKGNEAGVDFEDDVSHRHSLEHSVGRFLFFSVDVSAAFRLFSRHFPRRFVRSIKKKKCQKKNFRDDTRTQTKHVDPIDRQNAANPHDTRPRSIDRSIKKSEPLNRRRQKKRTKHERARDTTSVMDRIHFSLFFGVRGPRGSTGGPQGVHGRRCVPFGGWRTTEGPASTSLRF